MIKQISAVYFAEVIGFCLMGTHFHLLIRMHPGEAYSDNEIKRRFKIYYKGKKDRELADGQIPLLREKWATLSEYVKEIKQNFSRFYNRLHHGKGFFWSERFKSVIVDNGETLINCLAYIDLNPVRAGIAEKPEDYRWCSLGYHVQRNNNDNFLSLDLGLREFGVKTEAERLRIYRRFIHGKGSLDAGRLESLGAGKRKKNKQADDFEIGSIENYKYRSRYFTDIGILGTKSFIARHYQIFTHLFSSKHEKRPKTIQGMDGIYSLKRLSKALGN